MTENTEPDVIIGILGGPHGIKGEVKVKLETDFPERFQDMDEVRLKLTNGEYQTFKVKAVRFHKGAPLIKFEGCKDRTCAEEFRGAQVVITHEEMVELESDRFYIHDILGLDVYTTEGESLGKVTEVLQSGANDVYVTPRGMIPALKQFVREIDLKAGKMIVEPIEGLIEKSK